MKKETDAIIDSVNKATDYILQVIKTNDQVMKVNEQIIKKNNELEQYHVLANLSIEGVKDLVYVIDVETNVILFMNSRAYEVFGDGVGKKCYSVFHNHIHNCTTCNICELKKQEGLPLNSIDYFPTLGMLCFMTAVVKEHEGRKIRFERAVPLNGMTKEVIKLANQYNLI